MWEEGRQRVPGVAATAQRRGNPASLMWGVLEGFCLWWCFMSTPILGFSLLFCVMALRCGWVIWTDLKDIFRVRDKNIQM